MPHHFFSARNRNVAEMLIQHDNALQHTSLNTPEANTEFGWTVLSHAPYIPDLAPFSTSSEP
jgi:hypothetical protein